MKKLSQKEFIEKCQKVHNNKYDYSLVEYKNSRTKINIICPEHGVFKQGPKQHKEGHGCKKCSGNYKLTTSEFIKKSKEIHGDKYDYSLVEYVNNSTPVKLINKKYNVVVKQNPYNHLRGHAPTQLTTELFIQKSKEIHGDKYDYSLVEYVNNSTPVKLINKQYGYVFEKIPIHHLSGKTHGYEYGKITKEIFIKKCKKIHNNKYNYELVEINSDNNKVEVNIICPTHGIFKQSISNHMNLKQNCPKCVGKHKPDKEEFIEKCKKIHEGKYDYSLIEYSNSNSILKIICPIHGIFKQRALKHYNSEQGCPKCATISKGENKIGKILLDNNIEYFKEHSFDDCKYINKLPFDFYIPSKNILIEYDGKQHFEAVEFFGGEEYLKKRQKLDKIKDIYCKENNIHLIRIPYIEYKNIEGILKKENIIN